MAVISYKELILLVPQEEPSEEMVRAVMRRVERRELTRLRGCAAAYGVFGMSAVIALVPIVSYLAQSISSSGAGDYVSLIMSDGTHLSGSWSDLAWSLASSWPVLATAGAVSVAAVCLYSLRHFVASVADLSNHEANTESYRSSFEIA